MGPFSTRDFGFGAWDLQFKVSLFGLQAFLVYCLVFRHWGFRVLGKRVAVWGHERLLSVFRG